MIMKCILNFALGGGVLGIWTLGILYMIYHWALAGTVWLLLVLYALLARVVFCKPLYTYHMLIPLLAVGGWAAMEPCSVCSQVLCLQRFLTKAAYSCLQRQKETESSHLKCHDYTDSIIKMRLITTHYLTLETACIRQPIGNALTQTIL